MKTGFSFRWVRAFRLLKQEAVMRLWRLIPCIALGLFLSCASSGTGGGAGSSRSGSSQDLVITGTVVYADGHSVKGAIVTTDPLSEQVATDATGAFEISRGLAPGSITVKAEIRGNQGSVKMDLQYGAIDPIKIRLGENIEFSTVSGDSLRIFIPSAGESRTKIPR
ncbi:MAG TPA: carboxypeptidase-like regulatory domain-containing protein [bacterium]|nr:carboxypeptidase-like regulatory domain-containing protein [bacterium]